MGRNLQSFLHNYGVPRNYINFLYLYEDEKSDFRLNRVSVNSFGFILDITFNIEVYSYIRHFAATI